MRKSGLDKKGSQLAERSFPFDRYLVEEEGPGASSERQEEKKIDDNKEGGSEKGKLGLREERLHVLH